MPRHSPGAPAHAAPFPGYFGAASPRQHRDSDPQILVPSAPLNLARHHAMESHVPICYSGVTIYPGDIILGDDDRVMVLPYAIAAEITTDSVAHDDLETILLQRAVAGAALPGTYPPDDATKAAFEVWHQQRI